MFLSIVPGFALIPLHLPAAVIKTGGLRKDLIRDGTVGTQSVSSPDPTCFAPASHILPQQSLMPSCGCCGHPGVNLSAPGSCGSRDGFVCPPAEVAV